MLLLLKDLSNEGKRTCCCNIATTDLQLPCCMNIAAIGGSAPIAAQQVKVVAPPFQSPLTGKISSD